MRGIALLVLVVLGSALAWPSLAPRPAERLAAARPATSPPGETAAPAPGWNRISVPAAGNGHFYLEAQVDGVPVTFMVDSGATAVVLSPADARRIGLHPDRLRFTLAFRTANGIGRAAPVVLRELRIGQLALWHLEAVVNEASLPVSLLGASFLGRLAAWSVAGGKLHLHW